MSHKATNWAVTVRGIPAAAKVVLWHLADRHNRDTGRCDPDQDTLAADCEISRSSLNNQLRTLESAGLITRVRRINSTTKRQKSTYYILHFDNTDAQYAESRVQKLDTEAVSKSETDPCPNSGQSRVQHLDTNLGREPGKEPLPTLVPPDTPKAILCELAPEEAVESFLTYRRKSKWKALTATGARRLAKGLEEIRDGGGMTDDALAMAEERGWATVKPDWYFKETRGLGNGQSQPTGDRIAEAADAIAARWGQR